MNVQETIKAKIIGKLNPSYYLVINESHMHGGSATESHFNLTVVTTKFKGLSLLKRHQSVYKILSEEIACSVHALALHLYTPEEWQSRGESSPNSPDCRGGSKIEY